MKKKYIWIILIGIIILAAVLRLWQLGSIPPSPDWDEAAIGYDAYSLLHTGSDQFGKFLPVVLRSLNDYKPALYAYLSVPSILAFGLNVFAVRLPSAIFGMLSVLAVFFLVKEIFSNYKYKDQLSLLASFLLAISPWSIQFSRVGFESNVGTALNIFAALFFLKGLKKPWFLSVSAVFSAFSLYVYQSEKVFTPLLILLLVLIYRKQLFAVGKRYLFTALVVGLMLVLPMATYIVTDKVALSRLATTSIFSSQTEVLRTDVQKLIRDKANNDKLGMILDNRRIVYAKIIIGNYLSHFDLNWLFIKGDNQRHHAPNMGLLYLFELPFLFLGLYWLIFSKFDKSAKLTVLVWVLIAPLPASITTGVPHAVRTLNFLPVLQIIIALGIINTFLIISNFKPSILNFKLWKFLAVGYLLFAAFNFAYYLDQYFVQLNYFDSTYWQYGYKQAVDEVNVIGSKYKQIVISSNKEFDQSYVFFLFYLKYPPKDYQKIAKGRSTDIIDNDFGKYVFKALDLQKDFSAKNILYIGNPSDIPGSVETIKTIYNLDGTPAIKIAGT